MTVGERSPSVLRHMGFSTVQHTTWWVASESVSKKEITVFYNPILEVRSQHSCYTPFTRSKFPGLLHTQGKGLHQKVGIAGSHFRIGLLLVLLLLFFVFFSTYVTKCTTHCYHFYFRKTIPGAHHSFV